MSQSILLLEDEESLLRGIALKLSREGYQVHAAATIRQASSLLRAHPIDLVICDIGLPDGSGIDFCKLVRRQSQALVLMLSALDTELDIVTGYDAGADDYLTKPFSLMVLLSKVTAMLRRAREVPTAPLSIRSGDILLLPEQQRAQLNGEYLTLTPNEWKLLCLFMERPGCILSKRQLLSCLWDLDSDYADDNTVAVNIRRLREKIEPDPSAPMYIKNVRGMGYIWEKECAKE